MQLSINKKVTIILPTYNEKENIIPLIEQIDRFFMYDNYEIIVVDDNSPDGTFQLVEINKKRFHRLKLITRTSERGLVPSIKEGIKSSKGEICIWMDTDLSMSPKLLNQFVHEILLGADLVVGSRYIHGGGMKGSQDNANKSFIAFIETFKNLSISEDSIISAIISKVGNKIIRYILGVPLHDFTSGFFGVRKQVFEKIELEGNIVDYCISFPYRAIINKYKVVEVPMILETRKRGKSKTSNSLWSILKITFQCLKKTFFLKLQ